MVISRSHRVVDVIPLHLECFLESCGWCSLMNLVAGLSVGRLIKIDKHISEASESFLPKIYFDFFFFFFFWKKRKEFVSFFKKRTFLLYLSNELTILYSILQNYQSNQNVWAPKHYFLLQHEKRGLKNQEMIKRMFAAVQ